MQKETASIWSKAGCVCSYYESSEQAHWLLGSSRSVTRDWRNARRHSQ